jgi:hypothetical protein
VDVNTNAFRIVRSLTEEKTEDVQRARKVAAGKLGGRSRADQLSPERRKEIARSGSQTRWSGAGNVRTRKG